MFQRDGRIRTVRRGPAHSLTSQFVVPYLSVSCLWLVLARWRDEWGVLQALLLTWGALPAESRRGGGGCGGAPGQKQKHLGRGTKARPRHAIHMRNGGSC